MKRSGMPRPTSCALSHVTNVNKETNGNEDTEPRHCRKLLLAAAAFNGHNFDFICFVTKSQSPVSPKHQMI